MKLFSKIHLFKVVTLSMLLLFAFTSIAFASTKFDYVALGDSLAAGVTPMNTLGTSYTDLIAEKLDGEKVLGSYNNFGKSGYTTADILNTINPYNPENIGKIVAIKGAEIITLNIGANDLLPILLQNPYGAATAIEGVVGNIGKIIITLKALNPNAKIYLMGYYNAFNGYPLQEDQKAFLASLIVQFNLTLKGLATYTGCTYVDTYLTMDKHLTKYLPEANIHPDVFGYRAIAKEFWNVIKVDFLRGLN